MDKSTIKLNTVEDGDFEMISMITKILEDYFYDFVLSNQFIEISKEESGFIIQIYNKFGENKIGEILFTNQKDSWKTRPFIFWDFEISETAYLEDEEDFYLQMRMSFLKLLRKFKSHREDL